MKNSPIFSTAKNLPLFYSDLFFGVIFIICGLLLREKKNNVTNIQESKFLQEVTEKGTLYFARVKRSHSLRFTGRVIKIVCKIIAYPFITMVRIITIILRTLRPILKPFKVVIGVNFSGIRSVLRSIRFYLH